MIWYSVLVGRNRSSWSMFSFVIWRMAPGEMQIVTCDRLLWWLSCVVWMSVTTPSIVEWALVVWLKIRQKLMIGYHGRNPVFGVFLLMGLNATPVVIALPSSCALQGLHTFHISAGELRFLLCLCVCLDWLISRRHCSQNWPQMIVPVREKINTAIQDMPAVDDVANLLRGTCWYTVTARVYFWGI